MLLLLLRGVDTVMAAEQRSSGIELSTQVTEFIVGGAIPVKILYRNISPVRVEFKEPPKTWEMRFRVVRGETSPEDRPFGRMSSYTTSTGIERRTVEAAKLIRLDPRQEATFDDDIGTRWPELFSPGVVRVRVVDLHDELWRTASNQLTWRIVFKLESVDHLLAILANVKSTSDAKQFAMKWLITLKPNFHFDVERDDAATTHANVIALDNYRKWWTEIRNSDSVAKQLAAINRR
jgi:hypothetical protein